MSPDPVNPTPQEDPVSNSFRPTIAVVGATGQVGTVMLKLLTERSVPVGTLRLFASSRSAGKVMEWTDGQGTTHQITVEDALQRAAMLDPLTQIANRRHFDAVLEKDWQRAIRNAQETVAAIKPGS